MCIQNPRRLNPIAAQLAGEHAALSNAARKVKPLDGYYDVVVHGVPNNFSVLHNGSWINVDHRRLTYFIQKQPDYKGEAIRLISCQSGQLDQGIAQHLANKLGKDVMAPSDYVWIKGCGICLNE